jgi:hypothetical protein
MSGNLRRWLINGTGGAIVLFGSFFATLAVMDAHNVSVVDEARRGAEIQIKFDPQACAANLITLSCDRPYEGRYNVANNTWTITGRSRESDKISTRSDSNAPNQPGYISMWGGIGKFDRTGKLIMGTAVVGTVETLNKSWLQRLF